MKTRTTALASRPPLARMQRIHELLASGAPVNTRCVSQELEVSPRTIQRDVDFLRDSFELPIGYDAQAHTYRYTGKVGAVLFTPLDEAKHHAATRMKLPFHDETCASLAAIGVRYSLRVEHVLQGLVTLALADAECSPTQMDAVARAARSAAMDAREDA